MNSWQRLLDIKQLSSMFEILSSCVQKMVQSKVKEPNCVSFRCPTHWTLMQLLMDIQPLFETHCTHNCMMKDLRVLKDKQARRVSHLQFVRASLRNNITPGGLKINISLQATEADNNLRQKFQKIIQRTQIQLFKLLKVHHKVMRETLGNKIFNLERDIMHHR